MAENVHDVRKMIEQAKDAMPVIRPARLGPRSTVRTTRG